jgi:hypothetical protein
LFELLVDGSVVASHNFLNPDDFSDVSNCPQDTTVRTTLSATGLSLTAGPHEIRIRITRPGTNFPSASTPREYVDNVGLTQVTADMPTTKEQCKNDGWETFGVFKNQGDCVSFVASGGANQPSA